jgi:hypothetical protein
MEDSTRSSDTNFVQEILKFRYTIKEELKGNAKLLKVGDKDDSGSDS